MLYILDYPATCPAIFHENTLPLKGRPQNASHQRYPTYWYSNGRAEHCLSGALNVCCRESQNLEINETWVRGKFLPVHIVKSHERLKV